MENTKNLNVSIIGLGNFGKLLAKNLQNKVNLVVTDVVDKSIEACELGIKFVNLDEALKNNIIILAVPMQNFEDMLIKIKDKIKKDSLVIDVCSLKMFSCKLMEELLPRDIEIIGTHPLFGPSSAKETILGLKIAICNVRSKKETFSKLVEFCKDLGLVTIITTPDEHDKQMATSQALTHFIGRVLDKIDIDRIDMSTKTFENLLNIIDVIKNDTPELFFDMQTKNPFALELRNNFVNEASKLNDKINNVEKVL